MNKSQEQNTHPTNNRAGKPAIIFDFGGVLVDWNPRYLYRKLFNGDMDAVENFLREVSFFEWNLQQDAGRPFQLAVAEMCARFPQYCELISAYDQRYEEAINGAIEPVVDILRSLKDAGYPLYGLSNWPGEKYRQVKHNFPFFEWFDDVVISGEVKLAKPDPRIFTLLLERIGRPAQECVFIDDSPTNIKVAEGLGFRTILYRSPEQLQSELNKMILRTVPR